MKRRRGNGDPDDDEGEMDSALSTRRDIIMHSVALAVLGPEALDTDGRTIVNSILGAYGLPKISVTKGFKSYDDFDEARTREPHNSGLVQINTCIYCVSCIIETVFAGVFVRVPHFLGAPEKHLAWGRLHCGFQHRG